MNKPSKMDTQPYSQWQISTDIIIIRWLEITAPKCPKIWDVCRF